MQSFCFFCLKDMRMMYPYNEPENGPARMSCGSHQCDAWREEDEDFAFWQTVSVEEAHEQAIWEDRMFDAWPMNADLDEPEDEYDRMMEAQMDLSCEPLGTYCFGMVRMSNGEVRR